ncbi:MAG: sodium:calcium antiporter [Nanoarchaeota archaeon]|nr:sodium:calcium antiporter [Nanoarchaeota archaeon]
MLEYLLFFILAIVVLVKSVKITISSLTNLSKNLNLSEFVIATIFMGTATSLPEFFIGITSAIRNIPQLSLGNVIGASLLDLTIVLAIPILLAKKINPHSETEKKDTKLMFLLLFLPLILILDRTFSRIDGLILLIAFFLYTKHLLKQKRLEKLAKKLIPRELIKNLLKFFVGVSLLLLSSNFVVKYADLIAQELVLSPVLIGLIIVSVGTTLPELTFGIEAAIKKHPGMAVGNIVGSVVANMILVIGTTSIIRPIFPSITPLIPAFAFLILTALIFYYFIKNNKALTKKHALILSSIYILFLISELILK